MITNIKSIDIDKHSSILLVGIGKTNKYLMDVVQPESIEDAEHYLGESDLVDSYKAMLDIGVDISNIYLINLETMRDYLELSQHISAYDFSYIVPIDVYVSDFFYDPMNDGRRTYYVQYLLKSICKQYLNHSVIIATDVQASLYEDIDAFLNDMGSKIKRLKGSKMTNEYFERLIFTGNNIQNVAYANAVLAAAISIAEINEYPDLDGTDYKAVFDIDVTDNIEDMVFFKSHINDTITIENLLNLYTEINPIKIFFIYRILLYIAKELDFSKYIGSKYIPYKIKQIQQIVESYLDSILGFIITDYQINQIYATEDPYHPATVIITIKYEVSPIGCIERFIQQTIKI